MRVLLMLLLLCLAPPPLHAAEKLVMLGAGGVTGVYYPAGGAICRLVNRGRHLHGIRCLVETTNASIDNLKRLQAKDLDLGIVQSDWQYHAVMGTDLFKKSGKMAELRALFSLHSEPFTVVTRKGSGITSFDDLKGKRLSIGANGSGSRATMQQLMKLKGWKNSQFTALLGLPTAELAKALCGKKIDAFVAHTGHPSNFMQEVSARCPVDILPMQGKTVDTLLAANPFYTREVIPGHTYAGEKGSIPTFGVRATLVTTDRMSDETAYEITRSLFENFENFKTLHPVFHSLKPEQMAREGNTAPLHPGALRYYRERGWVQ
jgi:TRAP transporter TAXI family solute receptor